ncbi:hypothetical protein [Seonamhaeicola aphaedonensis]|nr:hypothetical protein [Seonamhaeicola aphaedonensis]
MTTRKRRILTLVLIAFVGVLSFAQKDGQPPPPPTAGPSPPGLTIGVSTFFLLGLALLLGIKKLLKNAKAKL